MRKSCWEETWLWKTVYWMRSKNVTGTHKEKILLHLRHFCWVMNTKRTVWPYKKKFLSSLQECQVKMIAVDTNHFWKQRSLSIFCPKIVATVFSDKKSILLINFVKRRMTIHTDDNCKTLLNMWKKSYEILLVVQRDHIFA